MKKLHKAFVLLTVGMLAGTAQADLVGFDIQTSNTALQLNLNAAGGIEYTTVDASSVGFSEWFDLAGLMQAWSSGVNTEDYGTALYTTAMTSFVPVSALGSGAFTTESLAQNSSGLDLYSNSDVTAFVNFWDDNDPNATDWGNNTLNFSVNVSGSRDQYQSDVAYVNDWFSYSRQYVIQLNGPTSASGVVNYTTESLLAALASNPGAGVSYYESWTRTSANCVVNESCTTLSYDGMQYNGFGQFRFAGDIAVDTPTSLALLAAAPLLLMARRRKV